MLKKLLFILILAGFIPAIASAAEKNEPVKRENIEWCDIWVTSATSTTLPRVLLIGDSISRGYYPVVEKALAGKACVARLSSSAALPSPEFLAEIKMVLSQYKFDVIHFNNGLHGWDYSEAEYQAALPELVKAIRESAPQARLIWATTTPVRVKGDVKKLEARTERVKARNEIAAALMAKEKIPVDDLFGVVIDHPEYQAQDGVHYNAKGYAALGGAVAKKVEDALK
jgi:lysophospholipase L1-like esterase